MEIFVLTRSDTSWGVGWTSKKEKKKGVKSKFRLIRVKIKTEGLCCDYDYELKNRCSLA